MPSISMWLPFLNWFVEIMRADQGTHGGSGAATSARPAGYRMTTMKLLLELWLTAQAALALTLISGGMYALGGWVGERIIAWVADLVAGLRSVP